MFDMIANDTTYRDRLEKNNNQFRKKMTDAGFTITGTSPIVPVMLGDAKLATDLANDMLAKGIICPTDKSHCSRNLCDWIQLPSGS